MASDNASLVFTMDVDGSLRTIASLGGPLALWPLAYEVTNAALELMLSNASETPPLGVRGCLALSSELADISGFFVKVILILSPLFINGEAV